MCSSDSAHNLRLKIVLVSICTIYFCFANGTNFAFSNFLTVFALESRLGLTKTIGARATAVYFASSCLMKFITIFIVARVRVIYLILLDLLILFIGSTILLFFGEDFSSAFFVGTILVGLGISTLFSSGIIWLKENMELTSQITSLFLIATTFGAQCFKIPIAAWIEDNPMSLIFCLCFSAIVLAITFTGAKITAARFKKLNNSINKSVQDELAVMI